jgi:hypothetical protein
LYCWEGSIISLRAWFTGWQYGSCGKAPASQVQGPEFKPQKPKKKRKEKNYLKKNFIYINMQWIFVFQNTQVFENVCFSFP